KSHPTSAPSTDLYIAGKRDSFAHWATEMTDHPTSIVDQVRRVEAIRAPQNDEKIRGLPDEVSELGEELLLEVVLHASETPEADYILSGFGEYVRSLGATPDFDRRLYAGGLCFLPVEAPLGVVRQLARFAFLRLARPMPKLRSVAPIERALPEPSVQPSALPTEPPVDPDLRVAVFDGGLDPGSMLRPWANPHDTPGVGNVLPVLADHGHAVTSALLFGSLVPGSPAPRPYALVDHYRILDDKSEGDPYELFDALRRVEGALRNHRYEFINLSLGPA